MAPLPIIATKQHVENIADHFVRTLTARMVVAFGLAYGLLVVALVATK